MGKRRHILSDSLPEGLQNQLDFIAHRFYNVFEMWVSETVEMRDFNINMRECLALEMLYAAKEGLPQHVLATHLNISQSVTVILIDRLKARGLVERKENPTNRRENLVFLNEDYGTAFVARMLSTVNAKTEDVLAVLPDGALRDFTRLSALVITGMEKNIA